jgi:GT2 family glycosyltransferase
MCRSALVTSDHSMNRMYNAARQNFEVNTVSSQSNRPDVSIVIVAWNAGHYLAQCLESLMVATPRCNIEVLVVDNASTDGTAEMIEGKFPWVRLIKSSENLGFARGNNVAIRQCEGRYIALVNPDVVILPGCLDELADFLDEHSKVGNVGPRILNPDMTLQVSCRRFPTVWNNFCSASGLAKALPKSRIFSGEQMFFSAHDKMTPVNILVGCFSMIRREAFETVGLLDETLFMYGDDLDWCRRCWDAGWEVVFYPGAQAIHFGGKTTAPYPVHFAVARQRSILRYWSKHHGICGVWSIRSVMLLHHTLRYWFALLSGFVRPKRKSESDVCRQVSEACVRELVSRVLREA